MPRPPKLDPTVLEAALAGLQAQRERVVEQIAQVRSMLGQGGRQTVATAPEESTARPKRRGMSAAGRKAIAEGQRKRWEAIHKAAGQAAAEQKAEVPRKRKMSAAARKRIGDATRKRWAEFRRKQK